MRSILLIAFLVFMVAALAQTPVPVQVVPAPIQTPIPVTQSESQFYLQVLTAVFGFIATIFGGFMTYLIAKLNASASKAGVAQQVEAEKTERILQTGEKVHALTNGNMRVLLQTHAKTTREMSNFTHRQADVDTADRAEQAVIDHDTSQPELDEIERGIQNDSR